MCGATASGGTNCGQCGGTLPVSGPDAGPPPPAAPRDIPALFQRRLLQRSDGFAFGMVILGLGTVIALPFAGVGLTFPPMFFGVCAVSPFPLAGGLMAAVAWQRGKRRLEVLRHGVAVVGQIDTVTRPVVEDGSVTTGTVTWLYDVGGQRYHGTASIEQDPGALGPGHPVHVVYAAAEPTKSELWPVLQ